MPHTVVLPVMANRPLSVELGQRIRSWFNDGHQKPQRMLDALVYGLAGLGQMYEVPWQLLYAALGRAVEYFAAVNDPARVERYRAAWAGPVQVTLHCHATCVFHVMADWPLSVELGEVVRGWIERGEHPRDVVEAFLLGLAGLGHAFAVPDADLSLNLYLAAEHFEGRPMYVGAHFGKKASA